VILFNFTRENMESTGEVEKILNRIESHKGVLGVVVLNPKGKVLKTSMDTTTTTQYSSLCRKLVGMAQRTVRDLDPQDDMVTLRIRTDDHEIMIAPGKSSEGNYHIVTLQSVQKNSNLVF
jgi:dynein light chain roadblock-type